VSDQPPADDSSGNAEANSVATTESNESTWAEGEPAYFDSGDNATQFDGTTSQEFTASDNQTTSVSADSRMPGESDPVVYDDGVPDQEAAEPEPAILGAEAGDGGESNAQSLSAGENRLESADGLADAHQSEALPSSDGPSTGSESTDNYQSPEQTDDQTNSVETSQPTGESRAPVLDGSPEAEDEDIASGGGGGPPPPGDGPPAPPSENPTTDRPTYIPKFTKDAISKDPAHGDTVNRSDLDALRNQPTSQLTDSQKQELRSIRETADIERTTTMEKVLTQSDANRIVAGQGRNPGEDPQIGGFVARAQDIQDLRSSPDYYNGLRLDYPRSSFDAAQPMYAVRYSATDTTRYSVPYDSNMTSSQAVNNPPPYTGNGYTGDRSYPRPEFVQRPDGIPEGAEMYRISPDGRETFVAHWDTARRGWYDSLDQRVQGLGD
jgi:hypothetical protein